MEAEQQAKRDRQMKVPLPKPVADIYRAVAELDKLHGTHKRKFTPDGHLVGSIGEVIAAEALGLKRLPRLGSSAAVKP
jgi:hypothetical protein